MIRHYVAAFRGAHPRCRFSDKGNLLHAKASLIADHRAGTALALQAVADSNAGWLALDCEANLPAAACSVSDHGQPTIIQSFMASTVWNYYTTQYKAPHAANTADEVARQWTSLGFASGTGS
jgi:hypothetical protein